MSMILVGHLPSVKPWYDNFWQAPGNFVSISCERHRIWRCIKSHSQNSRCLKKPNFELTPYMSSYNKHSLSSLNTLIQKSLPYHCPIWAFSTHRDMNIKTCAPCVLYDFLFEVYWLNAIYSKPQIWSWRAKWWWWGAEWEGKELGLTFYIFKKIDLLEISLCTFKILIQALAVSRQGELLSQVTFYWSKRKLTVLLVRISEEKTQRRKKSCCSSN